MRTSRVEKGRDKTTVDAFETNRPPDRNGKGVSYGTGTFLQLFRIGNLSRIRHHPVVEVASWPRTLPPRRVPKEEKASGTWRFTLRHTVSKDSSVSISSLRAKHEQIA
jgi:hypothetical protein